MSIFCAQGSNEMDVYTYVNADVLLCTSNLLPARSKSQKACQNTTTIQLALTNFYIEVAVVADKYVDPPGDNPFAMYAGPISLSTRALTTVDLDVKFDSWFKVRGGAGELKARVNKTRPVCPHLLARHDLAGGPVDPF